MTEYSFPELDVDTAGALKPSVASEFPSGFMVDMGSVFDFLSRLEDRRNARGLRYKLVHILTFVCWPN